MPELGPMMRALELQRVIEDKVSEWRERSARVAGGDGAGPADSYHQPLNFKRHTHRRKNSAEINRIIAKYSKHNKRTPESRRVQESQPIPPPRVKKFSHSKNLSKSEDNLAMSDPRVQYDPYPIDPQPGPSRYNARSCEDITVDIHTIKSKNFELTSILNAKAPPRTPRKKLHSISEGITAKPDLQDSGLDLRTKEFATSTPISNRKTCPSESSVFEKCTSYPLYIRRGSSEPDILSVSSIRTAESTKTLDTKKRWKLLKPPFKKGALDCLLLWRTKKPERRESEPATR